jgi:hypothetical protein
VALQGWVEFANLDPMCRSSTTRVWYVSYGSNMWSTRLACYLEGGTPPGGDRANPGARDRTPPVRSATIDLPGTLYFAGDSRQWGGGVAFYDHLTPGFTAARAYLVTADQFADIAAQEMYREPAPEDPLVGVVLRPLPEGRHTAGPGVYETLIDVGELDGHPLLTFTAPHGADEAEHAAPSLAYRAALAHGLRESRDWSEQHIAQYLDARAPNSAT